MLISVVSPSGSETTIIVKHADVGALAAHAKPSRGTDCKIHCLAAAGAFLPFDRRALNDPYIVVTDNIVLGARHDLLLVEALYHSSTETVSGGL